MKHLRIFILVLLAVLLPIRGAVAATMLCPEGDGSVTMEVAVQHAHHGMHSEHEMHSSGSASHHHAGEANGDGHSSSGEHPATCQFCASGGCMPSMLGSFPSLGLPSLTSSTVFPTLTTRVPAFQSGGQDRPPRTI